MFEKLMRKTAKKARGGNNAVSALFVHIFKKSVCSEFAKNFLPREL